MPYLSTKWTVWEVASWLAYGKPALVKNVAIETSVGSIKALSPRMSKALDQLREGAVRGRISMSARSIADGHRRVLLHQELENLEFFVGEDIPGCPVGLRSRADGVVIWGDLLLEARDVVRLWPALLT